MGEDATEEEKEKGYCELGINNKKKTGLVPSFKLIYSPDSDEGSSSSSLAGIS